MEYIVEITDMSYSPVMLTINKGDSVIWRNKDGMAHTATRNEAPAFDTKKILPDTDSISTRFDETSGTEGFSYFCKPHPFMIGKIVVI